MSAVKVGQVYKVKPEKSREWREDTLTISHVGYDKEYGVTFKSYENGVEYVVEMLEEIYDLVRG